MSRNLPNAEMVALLLEDCRFFISQMEAEIPEFLRRSKYEMRDGYPSGSRGEGRPSGISDPTADIVVTDIMHAAGDPVRQDAIEMGDHIQQAMRALRIAHSRVMANSIKVQPERRRDNVVSTCTNCRLPTPRVKHYKKDDEQSTALCPACYEYRRRTGYDRPMERQAG